MRKAEKIGDVVWVSVQVLLSSLMYVLANEWADERVWYIRSCAGDAYSGDARSGDSYSSGLGLLWDSMVHVELIAGVMWFGVFAAGLNGKILATYKSDGLLRATRCSVSNGFVVRQAVCAGSWWLWMVADYIDRLNLGVC